MSLTWTAPVSNGGTAIVDYGIQVSSDNGGTWSTFNDGVSSATAAAVTGLSNGRAYLFRVLALNAAGRSVASQASQPVTPRAPVAASSSMKSVAARAAPQPLAAQVTLPLAASKPSRKPALR